MVIYQFANNASTTLGSAITPTATSITVASGTGSEFPNPTAGQYFTATLWASGSTTGLPNEIVRVTSRTGDTMTVVRGQEGTTAQSWGVGDTFANYITAGFLNQLVDSGTLQQQSGNYAADAGTANAGVVTISPVPASFAALVGVPIRIRKMAAKNTGAYTLNVNNLGITAVNIGGLPLFGNELAASRIYEVVYNGTTFDLLSAPAAINGQQLVSDSVTNAILAATPAMTLKGNLTGATGQPYDVLFTDVFAALGPLLGTASNNFELPNGVIQQRGYYPGSLGIGTYNVSFPVPFTDASLANLNIQLTYVDSDAGGADNMIVNVRTQSTGGFTFQVRQATSGSGLIDGVSWQATGK